MPATPLPVSPVLAPENWAALAALRSERRQSGVQGLVLKHRDAVYGSGRAPSGGVCWKWKVDAMTVDAVLVYAQAGPEALQLLTLAKAYAGLTDAEFKAGDKIIRGHSLEKFGPVRSVRPTLVVDWPSKASPTARATRAAWRCGFCAYCGCTMTSRSARPTTALLAGLIPQEVAQI